VDAVADVFRHEYGRAVATLVRLLGDITLAEEAVQDAFVVAVERWPVDGVPPNPGGWIVTTARRRAIDRYRRESTRDHRHAQAALLHAPDGRSPGRETPCPTTGSACCSPAATPRWRSPRRRR
jgi:RNA polymerase sigma-70 factor (ECF subfamily)